MKNIDSEQTIRRRELDSGSASGQAPARKNLSWEDFKLDTREVAANFLSEEERNQRAAHTL
jgi:hypothetical protein